jgi:hypothetical protein
MKAKLKFDQAKIKDFLIQHAEKIVFGGFVVVFLLFAYNAVSQKPYDQTPESFNRASAEKETAISQATPQPVPVPQPPAEPPAVQSVAYTMAVPLYQPPFEWRNRRFEPVYYAVEDLHVEVGFGALAYYAPQDPNVVNGAPPAGAVPGGRFGEPGGKAMGPGAGMNMNLGGPPAKGRLPGRGGMGANMGGRFSGPPPPAGKKGRAGDGRFGEGGDRFAGGGGRFGERGGEGPGDVMMPQAPAVDPDAEQLVIPVAPPDSKVKGCQWAVITGLVPITKQVAEYRLRFGNAIMTDPNMDVPHYMGFKVQRAEVKPGTADKELVWQEVSVQKALLDMQGWISTYPEIVDPMYLSDVAYVCQPLPALVGKNFDKSVTHPRIPLAPVNDPMVNGMAPGGYGEMPRPAAGMGMQMGGPHGAMGMQMGGPRGAMGMQMGGGDRFEGMRNGPAMGGRMGMGAMGGMSAMGGMGAGRFGEGGVAGMQYAPPKIDYQLFRFFDFSVVPGKTYRYQVRLELANPNYKFPNRALDPTHPELAKGELRETPWSAPSPQVSVPRGSHLLASKLKPARGPVEQKVEVLVRNWNAKRAIVALQKRDLMRGEVANFSSEAIVDDPMTGQYLKEPDVVFDTNSVLVDMAGGESFDAGASKVAAPVEILVLGPDGNLFVRSQVTDADELASNLKEFKRREELVTQPDPNMGVMGDGRFGGMPGGDPEMPAKGGKSQKQRKGPFGGGRN